MSTNQVAFSLRRAHTKSASKYETKIGNDEVNILMVHREKKSLMMQMPLL